MNSYRCTLAALGALLVGGCHGGVETEILERELRRQEDYIYQLQDRIEKCQTTLQSCQASTDQAEEADTPQAPKTPASAPTEMPDLDDLRLPEVEEGTETTPGFSHRALPAEQATGGPGASEQPPALAARGVEQIVLTATAAEHPTAAGSRDRAGIRALIEPKTADGHVIHAPGAVSLMVLGLPQGGRQRRVARWDFAAAETAAHWRNTQHGGGIQLDLPWPSDPPPQGRHQLWARFVTPAGHKLLTSLDIDIDPQGRVQQVAHHSSDDRGGDQFTARSAPTARRGWYRRHSEPAPKRSSAGTPPPRVAVRPESNHGQTSPRLERPQWTPFR